jgi:hypothetical protein
VEVAWRCAGGSTWRQTSGPAAGVAGKNRPRILPKSRVGSSREHCWRYSNIKTYLIECLGLLRSMLFNQTGVTLHNSAPGKNVEL